MKIVSIDIAPDHVLRVIGKITKKLNDKGSVSVDDVEEILWYEPVVEDAVLNVNLNDITACGGDLAEHYGRVREMAMRFLAAGEESGVLKPTEEEEYTYVWEVTKY